MKAKLNIQEYIGTRTAIHCETQEQFDYITKLLGVKFKQSWMGGCGADTCIYLGFRTVGNIPVRISYYTAHELKYTILKATDFMPEQREIEGWVWKDGYYNKYVSAAREIVKPYNDGIMASDDRYEIGSPVYKRLLEAGVLNLWFNPIYKEAKQTDEGKEAERLRAMHYKLMFDIDNGVNTAKDGERYLASIYAAKLTIQEIQKEQRRTTNNYDETPEYDFWDGVMNLLTAKESACKDEMKQPDKKAKRFPKDGAPCLVWDDPTEGDSFVKLDAPFVSMDDVSIRVSNGKGGFYLPELGEKDSLSKWDNHLELTAENLPLLPFKK